MHNNTDNNNNNKCQSRVRMAPQHAHSVDRIPHRKSCAGREDSPARIHVYSTASFAVGQQLLATDSAARSPLTAQAPPQREAFSTWQLTCMRSPLRSSEPPSSTPVTTPRSAADGSSIETTG